MPRHQDPRTPHPSDPQGEPPRPRHTARLQVAALHGHSLKRLHPARRWGLQPKETGRQNPAASTGSQQGLRHGLSRKADEGPQPIHLTWPPEKVV